MFEFKNKTIDEFQKEISNHVGKEVTTTNGKKVILESVTENTEHSVESLGGDFEFMQHNGGVKMNIGWLGVKMYGFMVNIMQKEKDGKYTIQTEKILVPYEMKNIRMTTEENQPFSILQ